MDPLGQVIFDDKTFSDLLKEIHTNQKKKGKQIGQLIAELRPLIQNLGDATVVVPLIKEYMEISVKKPHFKDALLINLARCEEAEEYELCQKATSWIEKLED